MNLVTQIQSCRNTSRCHISQVALEALSASCNPIKEASLSHRFVGIRFVLPGALSDDFVCRTVDLPLTLLQTFLHFLIKDYLNNHGASHMYVQHRGRHRHYAPEVFTRSRPSFNLAFLPL